MTRKESTCNVGDLGLILGFEESKTTRTMYSSATLSMPLCSNTIRRRDTTSSSVDWGTIFSISITLWILLKKSSTDSTPATMPTRRNNWQSKKYYILWALPVQRIFLLNAVDLNVTFRSANINDIIAEGLMMRLHQWHLPYYSSPTLIRPVSRASCS